MKILDKAPNPKSKILNKSSNSGYVMPSIIILMVIMSTVAYATLISANNSLNLAYKQTYIQMARTASKAAIDYAQEQFDSSTCGAYDGTSETDLTGASNSRYRITMQAEVIETSADGYEKKIVGTGRVYLPKATTEALYVFDVRSEIVRTYAVCKTPDNFGPLVWLDASDTSTLKKTITTVLSDSTTFGGSGDSTRDTVEERVDNGAQGGSSWTSSDLEMHSCSSSEFSSAICNNNPTKYLYAGLVFNNMNIPAGATVDTATLTFTGGTPSGTSGSVTHRVCGIYETSVNPHKTLYTSSGSSQVRSRIQTANLHTGTCQDTSTNNFPPGNTTDFDVTNVIQEMVNHGDWDPSANEGRLGLAVYRVSGSGSRRALKNGVSLSVSYNTGSIVQANDTEAISQWDDKSANQYHAVYTFGNAPTREDNEINGKTIVRFDNGALRSTLTTALSGKRESAVFAVLKPNFDNSDQYGRVVSGMSASAPNDTGGTNSIIPLRRQSNLDGFSNYYANSGSYEATMGCGSCDGQPYLVSSVFRINTTDDTITGQLRGNGGSQTGERTGINPGSPPPPYTFGIDQLYFGGRRNGAGAGNGADYFSGDYAEIVVYDKALACREVEALEEYFRAKWAIAASQWSTTCPADTIPTL
ncbi:hypothetical protein A2708_02400 [Candidatus Saccharibacteria bacterium RIFCSPHIGHO2_01_FULL_49_21]|nr:MAG: hypothetical protein A2708_02400 [Candidatus Saccharibacteria bacterium RIFCSPHIGHO2_01_FULL_49_21]